MKPHNILGIALLALTFTSMGAYANDNPMDYETCAKKPIKFVKIPAIKDKTYIAARKKLIKAGWKPLAIKHPDPDTNISVFIKKGFNEVENCAGTGLAPCTFHYVDKYKNHLRVMTAGEQTRSSSAIVTGNQFVCAN